MSNPCGSMVLREFVYRDKSRTPVAVVDVEPCKTGRASVMLADNSLAFCYLNAQKKCIASPKPNAGQLRVECPPTVEYRFSGVCPCADVKTITYQVRAPAGSVRRFTVKVVSTSASGQQVYTKVLQNGLWESLAPITLRQGDKVRLSVTVLGKTRLLDAVSQDA